MQLRYYQQEASDASIEFLNNEKGNGLIVFPTGSGKSLVIADLIKRLPHFRTLMLVHSKKIVKQNYATVINHFPEVDIGICSNGLNRFDTNNQVIFGGIATIKSRVESIGKVDLILIDECHALNDNENSMYQKVLTHFKTVNSNLRIIGYTATPYKNGKGLLLDNKNFHKNIYDISGLEKYNKLVAEGHLAKMIAKPCENIIDTSEVDIQGGDFKLSQLKEAVKKNDITVKAVSEAFRLSTGRKKWIVFASGIDHTVEVANMLNVLGVKTTFVHSKQDDSINDKNLDDYEKDVYTAIVSNGILTTGFDCPRIDLLICLRPTTSVSLWIQMLGRAGRPHPTKENALILDFSYNCMRLGCINDPIIPTKRKKGNGEAPTKMCTECNLANHLSARQCFFCGAIFPVQKKLKKLASSHEIIRTKRIDREEIHYSKCDRIGFFVANNMLVIKYYCSDIVLTDYFQPQHPEWWAKAKAKKWWVSRLTSVAMPLTASKAFDLRDKIPKPYRIKWKIGKSNGTIISSQFLLPDGSSKVIEAVNFNKKSTS